MRVHKLNNVEKAMGLLEKNNVSLNHWFTNKLNNLNRPFYSCGLGVLFKRPSFSNGNFA